jgi:hypothetical protein
LTPYELESGEVFYASYMFEGREVVFKKEPDYAGAPRRGAISSEDGGYIWFVWDQAGKNLYVDQNRNLDLTDDPYGVFHAAPATNNLAAYADNQRFEGVRTTESEGATVYTLALEHYFDDYFVGQVLSGWEGDFEVEGDFYRLEYLDNANGAVEETDSFILLPETPLAENRGVLSQLRGQVPPLVALNGNAYQLEMAFEKAAETETVEVVAEFTPIDTGVGNLHISGKHLSLLGLNGAAYAVIAPGAEDIALPAGSYDVAWSLAGDRFLCTDTYRLPGLTVRKDETTELLIGGPLRHEIMASRRGFRLMLTYELKGAAGESYLDYQAGYDEAPEFEVYQEGRLLGKGRFTYG